MTACFVIFPYLISDMAFTDMASILQIHLFIFFCHYIIENLTPAGKDVGE